MPPSAHVWLLPPRSRVSRTTAQWLRSQIRLVHSVCPRCIVRPWYQAVGAIKEVVGAAFLVKSMMEEVRVPWTNESEHAPLQSTLRRSSILAGVEALCFGSAMQLPSLRIMSKLGETMSTARFDCPFCFCCGVQLVGVMAKFGNMAREYFPLPLSTSIPCGIVLRFAHDG